MDTELLSTLATLWKEEKFAKIIGISESVLATKHMDLPARYCAGMAACIGEGDLNKGLSYLIEMIHIYNSVNSHIGIGKKVSLFVGYSALQLAILAEFGEKKWVPAIDVGAKTAKTIGQDFGDKELEALAEQILERLWHTGVAGRPGVEAVYLRPSSPFVLQVEPTNHCNLRCRMCPRLNMTREKGYLDVSLYEEILASWSNRIIRFSIPHLLYRSDININLTYSGSIKLFFMGEPLLHPQLDRLIIKGVSEGCEVGVQTNGLLLEKLRLRRQLLEARPSAISVSLDGLDARTYETLRMGSNWDSCYQGLMALSREREEMGLVESIKLSVTSIVVPDRTAESRERALNFLALIRPLVDEINFIELDCSYDPEFVDKKGLNKRYQQNPASSIPSDLPLCEEPLQKLNILWDGTVTPCCYDINGSLKLGEASEGIDNIWQERTTKALQQALLDHNMDDFPICRVCRRL